MTKYTTLLHVPQEDGTEITYDISGDYHPAFRGDRDTPPEPETIDNIIARDFSGNEVDLDEDLLATATELLWDEVAADCPNDEPNYDDDDDLDPLN